MNYNLISIKEITLKPIQWTSTDNMRTVFVIEYYYQLFQRPLGNLKICLSNIRHFLNSLSSCPSKTLKPYKWNGLSEIQIDMKTGLWIHRRSWTTCCTWFFQRPLTQCTVTTLVCKGWKVLGHYPWITVSYWQSSIHQAKHLLVGIRYIYIYIYIMFIHFLSSNTLNLVLFMIQFFSYCMSETGSQPGLPYVIFPCGGFLL